MTAIGWIAPTDLPQPADPQLAAVGLRHWREASSRADGADPTGFADALASDPVGRALLSAVFGNSPFLTRCMLDDLGFSRALIEDGPEATLARVIARLRAPASGGGGFEALMRRLRRAKRQAALAIGLADIAAAWPVETVIERMSDFADAALGLAVAELLSRARAAGEIDLADAADPTAGSGLIVLGMGKLGARELNYSSDIDLIVLFDAERARITGGQPAQQFFVTLTKALVRLLDERTVDGYVFRTDLRLRPDPGATPVAISTLAAEAYYESAGQNWERAAMIKARPVAGDLVAGNAFLAALRPFLWRKHLDFAAIQDIHSIKRQIHASRGGARIAVADHNIKLGRGGIREIEFYVQTQQLIWGGREPALRLTGTVASLRALAAAGHTAPATAEEMIAAYRFLRRVEHRLQMIDDQQTHTLPRGADGLDSLAVFLGHAGREAFTEELLRHLHAVEDHYAALFEEAPGLGEAGNLVFTGAEDDPATLATLARLGFDDPPAVAAVIRAWHHGRYRATRSARAREILTELIPALLGAFGAAASPDAALMRFNDFLAALPAGVQLLSLFHSNPGLLNLVAEICGSAPRLARALSRNPALLDSVLSAEFSRPVPGPRTLAVELDERLGQARDFQDVLDIVRAWTADRSFQLGVQMLHGTLRPDAAGPHLSDLAETALRVVYRAVEEAFADTHGRVPGAALAIVAMGKFGGREMSVDSDLDLIFVYDNPAGSEFSDGVKKLPTGTYFVRLCQRFLNAVTALTAEGKLYAVDTRLRPSGSAGPLASSLDAFVRYQREAAWSWEHMALTRARVIVGPPALAARIAGAIAGVLTAPREAETLLIDVADMRARIEREHGTANPWRVKYARGGLVDIEFLAQYLQLRHGERHREVLAVNTADALDRLARAGLLPADSAAALIAALGLWTRLLGILRLTLGDDAPVDDATEAVRTTIALATGAVDFRALTEMMAETSARAHRLFVELVETPAEAARAGKTTMDRIEETGG